MKCAPWMGILLACLCCASLPAQAQAVAKKAKAEAEVVKAQSVILAERYPEVVAEVNGKPIKRDELAVEAIRQAGSKALTALISRELIYQEAGAHGVTATQKEIETYVQDYTEQKLAVLFRGAGCSNAEEYAQWLEKMGGSLEKVRAEIRATIEPFAGVEVLANKMLRMSVQVGDEEVRAEFDRRYGAKAETRQIVLRTHKEAEDVLKKLEMGASFTELVRSISIDTISRRNDGVIYLPQNSTLGKEAFKLKPGERSDIIEMEAGGTFHVIELLRMMPAQEGVEFEQQKERIREELTAYQASKKQQQWLDGLFRQAKVETHVVLLR